MLFTGSQFITCSREFSDISELLIGEGDSIAVPFPEPIPCWEMWGRHNEKARKCAHQNCLTVGVHPTKRVQDRYNLSVTNMLLSDLRLPTVPQSQ